MTDRGEESGRTPTGDAGRGGKGGRSGSRWVWAFVIPFALLVGGVLLLHRPDKQPWRETFEQRKAALGGGWREVQLDERQEKVTATYLGPGDRRYRVVVVDYREFGSGLTATVKLQGEGGDRLLGVYRFEGGRFFQTLEGEGDEQASRTAARVAREAIGLIE